MVAPFAVYLLAFLWSECPKDPKKYTPNRVLPRLLYKFSVLFASIYSKCLWIHSFGVYETPPGEVLAYTKQCVLHDLTAWGSLGAVNGPGSCPGQARIYTPDFRAIRLKQRFLQSRCHGGSCTWPGQIWDREVGLKWALCARPGIFIP